MSNQPLISVLIPCLNSKDYIRQCVESVSGQTLNDLEIICIDAGSNDDTVDILNQLESKDSRIKVLNSDKRSYGYQMNMGFDNASGEYIAIVESDDYVDKDMFQYLYDLAKDYDADIAKTTFYHEFGDNLVIDDYKKQLKDVENSFKLVDQPRFIHGHPSIWAGIYKSSFLKTNNIRFMEEDGAAWVDNPFFYETAILANNIVYRHLPFYYYRETNQDSSSNSLTDFTIPIKRMMDNLDIVDKYNCSDESVLKYVYLRAFAYIDNIKRRDGYEKYFDEIMPLIREMLLRLDENIVLNQLVKKHIDTYYRLLSPVNVMKERDTISQNDLNLIKKENEYLYSQIENYKTQLSNSKKENEKLKKELRSIKDSKAYKLGSIFR